MRREAAILEDVEADRFAAGLVAVTTAERAVVEAAMAWFAYMEGEGEHDAVRFVHENLKTACRALRLTRKAVDG